MTNLVICRFRLKFPKKVTGYQVLYLGFFENPQVRNHRVNYEIPVSSDCTAMPVFWIVVLLLGQNLPSLI